MKDLLYARDSNSEEYLEAQLEMIRRPLTPDQTVVGAYRDLTSGIDSQCPGLEELFDIREAGDTKLPEGREQR